MRVCIMLALFLPLIGAICVNETKQQPCGCCGQSCASGTRDGRDGRDGLSIQGPAGRDGSSGVDGRDCVECAKGPKGDKGLAGARGNNGNDGKAGKAGSAGKPGANGQKGDRGLAGVKGVKGDQGVPGSAGAPGAKGEKGSLDTATVSRFNADIAGLKQLVNGLVTKLKYQESQGSAQVKALHQEVDQLKKAAVQMKGGKIAQSVLPGGYAEYTVTDLQWQALHMSAAVGCRAVTATGGMGHLPNRVFARSSNHSCFEVCRGTKFPECDAELSIQGSIHKAESSVDEVGVYYNYGCETSSKSGWPRFEPNISRDAVLNSDTYISYCCCH